MRSSGKLRRAPEREFLLYDSAGVHSVTCSVRLTVLVLYAAIESLIALDQIKHASEILLPYFLNARKPGPDSRDAHPIYPSGKPKCDDSSQSVGDILLAECDNNPIDSNDDES